MRVRLLTSGPKALAVLIVLAVMVGTSPVHRSAPVRIVDGPYAGVVGVPLQVDATTEIREIGGVYWEFGDGSSDRGMRATKTFEAPGVYEITVTVKDSASGPYMAATTAVIVPAPRLARSP